MGALGLLGPQEVRGLGVFTGKFSLPALIFLCLSSLDLANTRWSFILAMFLSKTLVFLLVLLTDFLLMRDLSRAVLFAISSTQTNDFGLGLLFFHIYSVLFPPRTANPHISVWSPSPT